MNITGGGDAKWVLKIRIDYDILGGRITLSMEARIIALMMEFHSDKMDVKRWPPTPYHADIANLKLVPRAAGTKLTDEQKLRLRKGSKVLWLSWQVRFDALFGAVLVSRCASNPCELYEAGQPIAGPPGCTCLLPIRLTGGR